MPIAQEEAIRAYQRMHEGTLSKRAITKDLADDRAIVKSYLEEHPTGFTVSLEDARGNYHQYHVAQEDKTRAVLDKDILASKLGVDKSEITPSFLAESVEAGRISASQIQDLEDVSYHKAIKRTKVKRPLKKDERK